MLPVPAGAQAEHMPFHKLFGSAIFQLFCPVEKKLIVCSPAAGTINVYIYFNVFINPV